MYFLKYNLLSSIIGHVCIENVGLSKTVSQMLSREGYRVQEMKADKDKITKALPLSARMESGDVPQKRKHHGYRT